MIPQTFGLKAMGIAAGACLLLLIALGAVGRLYLAEIRAHGETRAELGAEQRARAADALQAKVTNDSNLEVIDAQQRSLAACAADAAARTAAVETALERERQRASGLQRMLDAERRAREAIYASDPGARQWAEQLVPLAIEQRLRARA